MLTGKSTWFLIYAFKAVLCLWRFKGRSASNRKSFWWWHPSPECVLSYGCCAWWHLPLSHRGICRLLGRWMESQGAMLGSSPLLCPLPVFIAHCLVLSAISCDPSGCAVLSCLSGLKYNWNLNKPKNSNQKPIRTSITDNISIQLRSKFTIQCKIF